MEEEETRFFNIGSMISNAYENGLKERLISDLVNSAAIGKTNFVVKPTL